MDALIREAEARDRRIIDELHERARKAAIVSADRLYGADKYGRDVQQALVIPLYAEPLPKEPEQGFRFIAVAGKRRHLWFEERWVELSSALMRDVSSGALRVAFSQACQYQESRHWHGTVLRFRDQHMQPESIAPMSADGLSPRLIKV